MAGNFFDQFDSAPASGGGNFFDQFDEKPAPAATGKDRTWSEAAVDTGLGLAKGAVNLAKMVPMAVGAADTLISSAFGLGAPASGGALAAGPTQALNDAGDSLDAKKSQGLKYKEKQVSAQAQATGDAWAAKFNDSSVARVAGEWGSRFINTVTDPTLLTQSLAENAASIVPSGLAGRVVQGATAELAPKLFTRLTEEAVTTAARRAGVAAAVSTGAVQQGTEVASDAYSRILKLPDDVWARKEGYAELAQQVGPDEAKQRIAGQLATEAGVRGGVASLIVNGAMAKFGGASIEAMLLKGGGEKLLEGGAKGALKLGAKDAAGETVTESLEEGYGAYAGNVAAQQVDPSIDPFKGVGEAAGAGGAAGFGMGGIAGGLHGFAGRPQKPGAPAAPPAVDPLDATNLTYEKAVDTYLRGPSAADTAASVLSAPDVDGAIAAAEAAVGDIPSIAGEKGIPLPRAGAPAGGSLSVIQNPELAARQAGAVEAARAQLDGTFPRPAIDPAAQASEDAAQSKIVERELMLDDAVRKVEQRAAGAQPSVPDSEVQQRLQAAQTQGDQQALLRAAQIRDRGQVVASQMTEELSRGDKQRFRIAYENVANRGGVATPGEAAVLDRMSPNERLYDQVAGNPAALKAATSPGLLPTAEQQGKADARAELGGRRAGLLPAAPEGTTAPLTVAPAPAAPRASAAERLAAADAATQAERGQQRLGEVSRAAQAQQAQTDAAAAAAATPAPRPAPAPDAVIAALKPIPALRTADQKATIDAARATIPSDQMAILEKAARGPFALDATERSQLQTMRAAPVAPGTATPPGGMKASAKRSSEQRLAALSQSATEKAGKAISFTPVDPASLTERRASGKGELSRQVYETIKQTARIFGKKVVVFDSTDERAADGFIFNDDSGTIYINRRAEKPHLVVFGHELMHGLKRDNQAAYDAVAKVVKLKKGVDLDKVAGVQGDTEELVSDLQGNRFAETDFWADVFREVAGDSPAGKQAVAKLAAAAMRAVNRVMKALGRPEGFEADQMVENLGEVKAAIKTALAGYAKDRYADAVAMDRAERAQVPAAQGVSGNPNVAANRAADERNSGNSETGRVQKAAETVQVDSDVSKSAAADNTSKSPLGDRRLPERVGPPTKAQMAARRARLESGQVASEKRAVTETPEFKAWWGASNTMVDASGAPMVLYHGTTKANERRITNFKRSTYGAMGPAVYLGDSPEAAAGYDQGALMKVYARGKYLTNAQWTKYVDDHGWKDAEAAATADGWAGVYDEKFENAVAVWDPANIKSADRNDGSFDEGGGIKSSEKRKPGQLDDVEAYHFSKGPRKELISAMHGTGLKGSGADEYRNAADERRRHRVYFYFDKGTGIKPEAGVGGAAHKASLSNVYDVNADPLKLKAGTQAKTETNILDAGFDGYLDRLEGTQSGQIIMLGQRAISVQALPPGTRVVSGKVVPGDDSQPVNPWKSYAVGLSKDDAEATLARLQAKPSWSGYELEVAPSGNKYEIRMRAREEEVVRYSQKREDLKGLPATVKVDGKDVTFGAYEPAHQAAEDYARQAGIEYSPPTDYVKVDPARAKRIADAFEAMEHNPTDPEVAAAYDALIEETTAQYEAVLAAGLKVEFIDGADPYGNPRNAILDVVENNHMWVFPTDAGFGGSASADVDISGNPLLRPTKFKISGRTALANDLFRVVHDYFGHVKDGVGFRADGEENAWRSHAAMFTPLARRALTTETRGQNSWVNYGPFAQSNRTANGADTQYAPQKIGLLPEWVSEEGRADDVVASGKRVDEFEMSTRTPYAKRGVTEDGKASLLVSDFAASKGQENWINAVADLVTKYPNYRDAKSADTPERQLERLVRQMTDNLLWLHDQVPATTRNRSKLWYDGARAIVDRWVRKYELTPHQAAGLLAVLSPQKDWYMNVSLAERVAQVMNERQSFRWSKQMTETASRIFGGAAYQEDVEAIKGQTLEDLESDYLRAMWLRVYDEAHNSRTFMIVGPEGDVLAEARTKDGSQAKVAWGGISTIAKAVSIFNDGSFDNISKELGRKHKVRNFYNNILVPNSPNGHVTIDTHAVAAALLRALSGNAIEVKHNFGGPSSAQAGLQGSYALYEEAYRRAAEARGLLPREMQSITWEAVRGLFVPTFKSQASNVKAVDGAWNQFKKGRLSYENTRDFVSELAGGIEPPGWLGRDPGAYVEDESAADEGDVSGDGVSERDAEPVDGGAGGRDPGAAAQGLSDPSVVASQKRTFLLLHAGRDFDQVDKKFLGSGEPGNIRPLGKGFYGYLVRDKDLVNIDYIVDRTKDYLKYAPEGDRVVHAFKLTLEPGEVWFAGRVWDEDLLTDEQKQTRADYQAANALEPGPERTAAYRALEKKYPPRTARKEDSPVVTEVLGGDRIFKSPELVEAAVNDTGRLERIGKWEGSTPSGKIGDDLYGVVTALPDAMLASAKRDPVGDTSTPEFKAWFGNSKLVDKDGQPLMLYHGTQARNIQVFKRSEDGALGPGIYLTQSMDAAGSYAGDGGTIEMLYARMEKPLVVYTGTDEPALQIARDDAFWKENFFTRGAARTWARNQLEDWAGIQDPEFLSMLKDAGYDGVILKNPKTDEIVEAMVPSAYQVKSTLNDGEWSPRDPNIYASSKRVFADSGRQYTPEQLKAFGNIGRVVEERSLKERLQSLMHDWQKKLAQGLVDQFAPIKDLGAPGKAAYALARLSKGSTGAVEALLHHGKLKLTADGVYDADRSGGMLERLLAPLAGETGDFFSWVAGNRAEGLLAEDREKLFTPGDIAALKTLDQGTLSFDYTLQHGPNAGRVTRDRTLVYRDALKTFNEFNRNALDMAEQSGLIDKESRKIWESEFYVPFYRVSDDGTYSGVSIKDGLVRQKAFERLKGGKDKLKADLMENALQNIAHLIDAAAKNRAALATIDAAQGMGVAYSVPSGTKGSVWVMRDGHAEHYAVEDPYTLRAISSLTYSGLKGPLWDVLTAPKRWLTIGVTSSPAFKVRNLVRDSMTAVALSDLDPNILTNLKQGWKASSKDSQSYVSALAGGGLIRFGTMFEGRQSDRMRQMVKQARRDGHMLDSETALRRFYDTKFEPAIAAYNELGNRSEEINRAALYQQLKQKGFSDAEANLAARDLMDFSMQGAWGAVRMLSQLVPFFNARLQGMYKLGRGAAENPKRFAAVLGAVALASVALMAAYSDDDDWKKREDWDRNGFWWFKFGGIAYRIPKPFEIGAIATLAERGIEFAFSPDMTGKRYAKNVRDLLLDNLSMDLRPQAIKPIIEVYANRNSFTDRPIENLGMQKLLPEYRVKGDTTMTARGVSAAGNAAAETVPGKLLMGGKFLSPVQVDHLIQGYFGWLGGLVLFVPEMIMRGLSDQPSRPARDWFKFATQGIAQEVESGGSYYVSALYNQAEEIEKAYGTYRQLLKEGKRDEALAFFDDHRDELRLHKTITHAKAGEAKYNEMVRIIERSNRTPEEKKRDIQDIRRRQDALARMAVGAR